MGTEELPVGGGGGGSGLTPGGDGETDASTWGSVYPHFLQKRAPSLASSPQWRQTVTDGGKVNGVYHRQGGQ
jgi:hypothetical protein